MSERGRSLVTALCFAALSALFSWPLVTDPLGLQVSRQFDLYSLLWVQSAARPGLSLVNPASAWPIGENLARLDSFVMYGLARSLDWLEPRWAAPLCALLGPVASAWAAERLARRELGAAWPWSLIAGSAYGFSGLMAIALLEGHVYAMLAPWLPLMAGALLRGERSGRGREGLLAGLYWTLSLLTSAYLGIAASLLALFLALPGLRRRPPPWRPAIAAAATAGVAGTAYAALFLSGEGLERAHSTTSELDILLQMAPGSARLGGLAGWNPTADLLMHSITPTLGFTALALALFAPRMLVATPIWRRFAWAGAVALALSLGPALHLYHLDLDWPWLLYPLKWIPAASFFHHPARLLWITQLSLGGVAALVATRIALRRPRAAGVLLACAAADALLGTGAPLRTARIPIETPSAYGAAPEGWAVLELLPVFTSPTDELELYFNNLTCAYQADHGRPLLNRCLGTTLLSGPRWEVSSWLVDALLRPEPPPGVAGHLEALGIGAVALHPDLFPAGPREAILQGLVGALGPANATSADAGERVILFAIPGARAGGGPPPGPGRIEALERLSRGR